MGKLTLSIESETIEKAKQYAKNQHTSLSKLIQKYLKSIAEKQETSLSQKKIEELPDWIKEIIVVKTPTSDFNHKAEYGKHLEEKYGV